MAPTREDSRPAAQKGPYWVRARGLIFLSFVFILLAKLTYWLYLASVSNVRRGNFTRFLWNNVLFALTARVLFNIGYLVFGGLGSVGKSSGVVIDYFFFRGWFATHDRSSENDTPLPQGSCEDDKRWYEDVNGRCEDEAPLPQGWFTAYDNTGIPFYCASGENCTFIRPVWPAGSPLPDGWFAARDPYLRRIYYFSTQGQKTWIRPRRPAGSGY